MAYIFKCDKCGKFDFDHRNGGFAATLNLKTKDLKNYDFDLAICDECLNDLMIWKNTKKEKL